MSEATDTLRMLIASGCYDAAEAVAVLVDRADGALPERALLVEARALVAQQGARERAWDEVTVNDRLDAAFEELTVAGIVCLQNAGYTLSDGWSDAAEVAHRRGGMRGAVFYHGQDLERGVDGQGLMRAYGAFDNADESATESIGREVVAMLELHGISVVWDGRAASRLQVPPFEWRKRATSRRPGRSVLITACALEHRLAVMKACRAALGLELAAARAGLESLKPRTYRFDTSPPWVAARHLPLAEAERALEALRLAGAEVSLR